MPTPERWRVGELAELSGLTVRALHHYDDIGLLRPDRTAAGHRVYGRPHLERLYRITVLRRFGTPLEDIERELDDPAWTLGAALRANLAALEDEVLRMERMLQRLVRTETTLTADGRDPADELETCRRLLVALQDAPVAQTDPLRRIAVMVYEDLEAAHEYLVRVFGLEAGPVRRGADGSLVQAEVRTADGLVMLHPVAPRWRLASPAAVGAATGMLVVTVQDVDAHHDGVVARGGTVTFPPTDQDYGVREYGALGPEGEPWSFWTPLSA